MFESFLQKVSKIKVTFKNKHRSSLIKQFFATFRLIFNITLFKGRAISFHNLVCH